MYLDNFIKKVFIFILRILCEYMIKNVRLQKIRDESNGYLHISAISIIKIIEKLVIVKFQIVRFIGIKSHYYLF